MAVPLPSQGVPVFYHTQYTSRATSNTIKKVRCDECDHRYAYEMERTGVGGASTTLFNIGGGAAAASAERGAERSLTRQLRGGVDVVPCPECGHIQDHMLPRARHLHLLWMWKYPALVPVALLVTLPVLGIVARVAAGVNARQTVGVCGIAAAAVGGLVVLTLFAAAGLAALKFFLSLTYNPNRADVDARIEEGRELALSQAEYDRNFRPRKSHAADPGATLSADDFGLR